MRLWDLRQMRSQSDISHDESASVRYGELNSPLFQRAADPLQVCEISTTAAARTPSPVSRRIRRTAAS